ncbi:MAG: hypothetical protein A2570_00450 [Candidatus Brennerbacteria bacterium RIFOXYD1_FULL_41_16]|uniref:Uncharacterized protein n=1 Tax=Candidatus Brennerbacteria bacterium RIFOXYD1_FULL_41_16 TaxID=1797529 RepID=A0A1G1XLU9_9BACT|nr:MAG: hypothetical protein UU61_C0014G0002 [Parcubacteria group bacterium GW2011_GWB1_41_4]OGY40951.1 MAG: hypothetical protein A2570_00450 [Candidatus Brennerbacteria bacterium RIFOXYD1_FULL_41_16]
MFNTKKDRMVVEITIEFNISAIGKWLKSGGKFEDIDKLKRDWKDAVTQKYVIDMLPIGQSSNAYFHRNKGVISQNIWGIDYLENAKEDIKYIAEKEAKIGMLSWDMWRGCLGLKAHKNLILLTPPLTEVVELETTGKLKKHEKASGDLRKAMTEEIEINVPYSFDDNNNPKEFMKVWRGSASDRSLGYGNALGHISFSTLNFEVEY